LQAYKKKGFWLGLILFLFIFFSEHPDSISRAAWLVLATALLMAIWWGSEAIPLAVTSLLPLVLFPLFNIGSFQEIAQPYANQNIYLFLGGFILALAIESSNLHRRLALNILSRASLTGANLIGSFMLMSAFISMWIINTATTLMLLPIALAISKSVLDMVKGSNAENKQNFEIALLLGIAYSATIGGMATLVGTAPNIIFAGFMQESYGIEVSFLTWMKIGLPISLVMLVSAWFILTHLIYPVRLNFDPKLRSKLKALLKEQGVMTADEKKVLVIFVITASAWIFRENLNQLSFLSGLTDAGIAITAALSFFIIPSQNKATELLAWDQAKKLPWGLLLLFGGGLSLASAIVSTGLGGWLGSSLSFLANAPIAIILLVIILAIVLLTEITSNTATTVTFLPIAAAVAVSVGANQYLLTLAVVLSASCAFMLPVATPPNAVIFGSGKLDIKHMIRAGLLINIAGIVIIGSMLYVLVPQF